MTKLATILEWKFPGQQGMDTGVDDDGIEVVTAFPEGVPSQNVIDGWISEYEEFHLEPTKTEQAKEEMYRVIAEGFKWRADNSELWFDVLITPRMEGFLTRTLLKLESTPDPRISPHGGFIRSNGVSISIDDIGMKELCLFAGVWGDAISEIHIRSIEGVTDWSTFDPYADINWSVQWTGDDASNGWTDNTLTQAP